MAIATCLPRMPSPRFERRARDAQAQFPYFDFLRSRVFSRNGVVKVSILHLDGMAPLG